MNHSLSLSQFFAYRFGQIAMLCLGAGALLKVQSLEATAVQYFFGINYENPAELQRVQTGEIYCGLDYLNSRLRFKGSTILEGSGTAKTNRSMYPPCFQIAYRPKEKIVVALSYTTPVLAYLDWGTTSILRNTSIKNVVNGAKISPRFSCQCTERLAIGLGLDAYFDMIDNELNFVVGQFGEVKNKFGFFFLGFDVGLLYRLTCNDFISLCYYSGRLADATGRSDAQNGATNVALRVNPPFPWIVYANWSHLFNENFVAYFKVIYSGFSMLKQLILSDTAAGDLIFPTHWKNTWAFDLGAKWTLTENWELFGLVEYNTNFAIRKYNSVAYPGSGVGVIDVGVSRKFCENFRFYLDYGYSAFLPKAKIDQVGTGDKGKVSLRGTHVGARIVCSW